MERLLLFVHYNPWETLSSYVIHTLKQMHLLFRKVVFISNSKLPESARSALEGYCHLIMVRQNRGFDFGAWKDALLQEGWEALAAYDSLTLMNDTCFGPFFDLSPVFASLEADNCDFWCITNHKKSASGIPGPHNQSLPVPEHAQSYFITFKQPVVQSKVFAQFWESVTNAEDVLEVIRLYEAQLTAKLSDAGFTCRAWIDTRDHHCRHANLATWHPDILLKTGSPFLKVKSFLYFPNPDYLKTLVREAGGYDSDLIEEHLNTVYPPNISLWVNNKTVITSPVPRINQNSTGTLKVAIHLHVFYVELLHGYLTALRTAGIPFDLYLTTDSEIKKETIATLAEKYAMNQMIREIAVLSNRGRNLAPWLKLAQRLSLYDLVGHFHTKKTAWADAWIGDSWQREIIQALIVPARQIAELFKKDATIGIVIPDVPSYYQVMSQVDIWGGNRNGFKTLWKRMNCKKHIDTDTLVTPVMPYGMMFWYRPDALQPLFDLNLSAEDFESEPLGVDGSLAHVLERLPVYIAWSQHYDFRIAVPGSRVEPRLLYREQVFKKSGPPEITLSNSYGQNYTDSYTWKAGRCITWLPGKILGFIRKLNLQHYTMIEKKHEG